MSGQDKYFDLGVNNICISKYNVHPHNFSYYFHKFHLNLTNTNRISRGNKVGRYVNIIWNI